MSPPGWRGDDTEPVEHKGKQKTMAHHAATARRDACASDRRTEPATRVSRARRRSLPSRPLALVMGDIDMVGALGFGGIPSALFDSAPSPARFSRHVRSVLPWHNAEESPSEVVQTLLAFASTQPAQPVLFPQTDEALLLASRHRDELGHAFRCALPPADLVEQLVDKGRFQTLAEERGLPIPHAHRLRPLHDQDPRRLPLRYPLVIKPVVRRDAWELMAGGNKAFHVESPDDLAALWPRLVDCDQEILAQAVVDGPETRIVSFHAYVDADGEMAGSFTGRKIRTYPQRYGHSTSVEITELPDVARLGREILGRIGFRGVVKLDFKRDARRRPAPARDQPAVQPLAPPGRHRGREPARARLRRSHRGAASGRGRCALGSDLVPADARCAGGLRGWDVAASVAPLGALVRCGLGARG